MVVVRRVYQAELAPLSYAECHVLASQGSHENLPGCFGNSQSGKMVYVASMLGAAYLWEKRSEVKPMAGTAIVEQILTLPAHNRDLLIPLIPVTSTGPRSRLQYPDIIAEVARQLARHENPPRAIERLVEWGYITVEELAENAPETDQERVFFYEAIERLK
ncbi:MAG: hypothetical protein R3B96_24385 [Pirellulaceae bacterium]